MVDASPVDWKDVANAQFGKASVLALAIILLVIMGAPAKDEVNLKLNDNEIQLVDTPQLGQDPSDTLGTDPPGILVKINFDPREEFVPYEAPPEIIHSVVPEYSSLARKNHISGIVMLNVEVYADGTIGRITVARSLQKGTDGLDQAAVNAVRKWKFSPGLVRGRPVNTTVMIPLEFSMKENPE